MRTLDRCHLISIDDFDDLLDHILQDSVGVIQRVMALPPGVEPSCIY